MAKALITGASSGIGECMAKILSEKGYETILVARRGDRLQALSEKLPTESTAVIADLSRIEDLERVVREHPDIDILINNAGFGVYGEFCETDFGKESDMIDVNIRALHFLMKAYLPHMKKKGGKILNVASSAAFFSGPLLSSYYASKAYVLRLSNAVREELRRGKAPVTITVLCPGPVETEFGKVSGSNLGKKAISAEDAARLGINGMLKGKSNVVPTATMKFTRFISKILPESLSVRFVYNLQNKKRG